MPQRACCFNLNNDVAGLLKYTQTRLDTMQASAHDSRPHKRPRTSGGSPPQASTSHTTSDTPGRSLKHHSEELWFSDGNIVFVTDSFSFKVHRGQLQRHSEFFEGMFDIPQPTEQDMVDGCPSVDMSDSPDDMYYFLKALYDGLCVV